MTRWSFPGLSLLAVACASFLVACGGDDTKGPDTTPDPDPENATYTYYRDVKEIIDTNCVGCHQPGQIGVGNLVDYDNVASRGSAIKQQVVEGVMPPWHADSDCNDYMFDRSLTPEQIDTIATWVDEGAPMGDAADEPVIEIPELPTLSSTDFTLEMPVDYVPDTAKDDDYRCFVLPWPEADTSYVTGVHVHPDNASAVHHVIAFYADASQAAEFEALDAADPGHGYSCFGGAGGSGLIGLLAGWAPGGGATELAPGTGIEVQAGSVVVIQMHYNTLAFDGGSDRTKIDFQVTDSVSQRGWFQFFTNPAWPTQQTMNIPAGAPDTKHAFAVPGLATYINDSKPFTIWGTGFHMHTRGTTGNMQVLRAGGEDECLLDIPRWDFDWQGGYGLMNPIEVSPQDGISIECHWDNSPENQPSVGGMPMAPRDLNWGEGTNDEMCLGSMYITSD